MKRSTVRICGAAAVLAAVMIAAPRLSPAPAYMKLGDIKGEATDPSHAEWIEVNSWSWGESNPGYVGVPTTEKVSVQDLSFTKRIDKSSPQLMLRCASGEPITSATLAFTRRVPGAADETYLQIEFENTMVSSYQHGGGAADGTVPTESISLNFEKIRFTYFALNAAGGPPTPITTGWDIKTNRPIGLPGRTGVIVE